MNNCCIKHKIVNNINSGTIVTLNGSIDFINIADLEAASGSFKNLNFAVGFGAYAEINAILSQSIKTDYLKSILIESDVIKNSEIIFSTTIENQENIQTNTFTANASAQIAQITISKNSITSNAENVIINVPVQLSDSPGSSDYVCHLPQRGTQVTYKWPSPPRFKKKT